MQNIEHTYQNDLEYSKGYKSFVSSHAILETVIPTSITERFHSRSTKVGHNTRISSRRFTGTDNRGEVKTFGFTRVHGARVITTWGLSRPDGDLFSTVELQESTVLSFDDINIVPTNSYGGEGIINPDALIKNLDTGLVQQQVDTSCNQNAPSNCGDGGSPSTCQHGLKVEADHQQVGDVGHHKTSTRSEEFSVIHGSILSRNMEVLYV